MESPKISLLMSTYNRPQYLKDALRSVIAQSLKDWEVILINDGGVDVSDIVAEIGDNRIKYIKDTVNSGKAVRMNQCLEMAKGEYIAYLDDDDILYPNHFEELSKALDADSGIGAAYSDLYGVQFMKDEKTGRRYVLNKFIQVSRDYNRDFMFHFNHTLHVSLMHRRDLALQAGGYDPNVTVLIDWNITRKLSFYTDFKYVHKVTGEYYMPLGASDRISNLERKDPERFKHNLRKIKADLPPEPWPKVKRIGVVLPVKRWDEDFRQRFADFLDHIDYPVRWVLVNNSSPVKPIEYCREVIGQLADLKNVTILTPSKTLSDLDAYRFGASRLDTDYVYLPTDNADPKCPFRIIRAVPFLEAAGKSGIKWNVKDEPKSKFDIIISRSQFLKKSNKANRNKVINVPLLNGEIPESLKSDYLYTLISKKIKEEDFKGAFELIKEIEKIQDGAPTGRTFIDAYVNVCSGLKYYDLAEEKCRRLIAEGCGGKNWMLLGKILQSRKAFQEAAEAYRAGLRDLGLETDDLLSIGVIKNLPEDFAVVVGAMGLGECLAEAGDFPEAAKMFRRAARVKPESPRPFLGFARIFMKTGDLKKAREAITDLIKRDQATAEAYLLLGSIEEKENRLREAFVAYKKSLELEPKEPETQKALFRCGERLDLLHDVLLLLNEALESCPASTVCMKLIARAELKAGNAKRALEMIEKIKKISPSDNEVDMIKEKAYKIISETGVGLEQHPKGKNEAFPISIQHSENSVEQHDNSGSIATGKRSVPESYLFIMDEGIGNMIMATPAMRALKEFRPEARLCVLGKRPALDVLQGWDIVAKTMEIPDDEHYDVCLKSIWSKNTWASYGGRLAQQSGKVIETPWNNPDRHESQYHLDLIRNLGWQAAADPMPYCARSECSMNPERDRPWVGLCNTSLANGAWERKRWPHFRQLAQELNNLGFQVVLIGGAEEQRRFERTGWPEDLVDLQGRLDLSATADALAKCSFVIATDSGPAHIAAAMGTPTFVLFGPTRDTKNRPIGPNVQVIRKPMHCSPCQYTERWVRCSDWQCMSSLKPEDVMAALPKDLLSLACSQACKRRGKKGKVLLVGVLDVPSSTNVFMKNGFNQLGYEVDAYNYRTRQRDLGSAQMMWNDFKLSLEGKQYDLILFSKVNGMHPDCISTARKHGTTWYWFMDNLNVAEAMRAHILAAQADFCSATSEEVYSLFARFNRNAFKILEGFDPNIYFDEGAEKTHEVVFFGSATEKRVHYLRQIALDYRVEIFGTGWPEDLKASPPVFNEKLRQLINRSKIVLNFVHSNIFSDRVLLSAASGGFVLTEYCPDLENYFKDGEHLRWFKDIDEAKKLIEYYLSSHEERARIAANGMRLVQERFSWSSICSDILERAHSSTISHHPVKSHSKSKRVLFVSWHGLGDNVMLTPALRKYKQLHPDHYIAVAGLKRFGKTLVDLLWGLPFIDEVIPCLPDAWNDFPQYRLGVEEVQRTANLLGARKSFDEIVLLPTNRLPGYRLHKVFRFANEIGVSFDSLEDLQTELNVTKEAELKVADFIKEHIKPILILHTIAGNHPKTLPYSMAEQLIDRYQGYTVFEFGRRSTHRSILIKETDMQFSKALIKRADMVIAIDSVVMHIAGAFMRPCLAVFTSTPVHQALPLTYRVDITGADNEVTEISRWPVYKSQILQTYPRRTTTTFDDRWYYEGGSGCYQGYWWGERGGMGKRIDQLTKMLVGSFPEAFEGKRILDVGCAAGYYVKLLRDMGHEAYGCDPSEWIIKREETLMTPYKKYLMIGSTSRLPFDLPFDTVLALNVLEHCTEEQLNIFLSELMRIRASYLIIQVPQQSDPLAFEDPTHILIRSEDWWDKKFSEIGCTLIKRVPYTGAPLWCYKRDSSTVGSKITITPKSYSQPLNYLKESKAARDRYLQSIGAGRGTEESAEFHYLAAANDWEGAWNISRHSSRPNDLLRETKSVLKNQMRLPNYFYHPLCYWAHMLTFRCNARCPFCILNGRGMHQKTHELSGRDILEFWNKLDHRQGQRLSLIGGEPTLHRDFVEIVNNLEGYQITITTNCKGPFYEDAFFHKKLRPRNSSRLRINTTFHPHHISSSEYLRVIAKYKETGYFVDQTSFVFHPQIGSFLDEIKKVNEVIPIKAAPYLGFYDKEKGFQAPFSPSNIEPNENYHDLNAAASICGLTDLNAYRDICGQQEKRVAKCIHPVRSLIISPDGLYYHCHYKLYYGIDPVCSIKEFDPIQEALPIECRHYGFCNWCDVPRVGCKPNPTASRMVLNKLYDKRESTRSEIKYLVSEINAFSHKYKLEFNPLKWFEYAYSLLYSGHRHRGRVLDVGSARSVFPYYLAYKGYNVTTLDIADSDYRNQMGIKFNVDSRSGDIRSFIPELEARYDLITNLSVIEHIDDDTGAVLNLAKYLAPGGIMVISTDFYPTYIEYPHANRTIVKDRPPSTLTDSRVYNPENFLHRIIMPLKKAGLDLIGEIDYSNVDINNPNERAVRGLYTFGIAILRRPS
jgi:ADP-heptose:LPS heptosyltransferase/glycosyltransferase involved in cell wall biosynthesis/2-polyprenyl-3-methyl-5-hydroxy-6-metoxy-1,4-benzoquinol methylase/cytochrome c-type biogenesis protein CcmH/NrfG